MLTLRISRLRVLFMMRQVLLRRIWLGAASIDIDGAFNNVTTSIEDWVRDIHAPDFLVRFISLMLGNRLIRSNLGGCFTVKGATRVRRWEAGVLSRLLCFLVANVGLRLLESRGFKVVVYADDIVIDDWWWVENFCRHWTYGIWLGILSSWAANTEERLKKGLNPLY